MFGRLVQKELLHHLLDFRFIAVFALCALLSVLSVYAGTRTYRLQLQEYDTASEQDRSRTRSLIESRSLYYLRDIGLTWNRRPEVLSPVVYGLSGTLGREVFIHRQHLWLFTGSLFSVDPIHALFGTLDFAFIVEVILSLCVLLLTYDAVCGEKEGGTLRLYASFPVARSTLALAKLVGSVIAVLVPFAFSFLLASAVLALSPELGLRGADWGRMVALMGTFALYLVVFAAFGLWGSALTHRRMTAFLGLMGLWTVWAFIVPNLAVRAAQSLAPVESFYELGRQVNKIRWEVMGTPGAPEMEYNSRLRGLLITRHNQTRRQQNLTETLSVISPLGAVSFASMDMARTGLFQQERLEDALGAYHLYLARFLQAKKADENDPKKLVLSDLSSFVYQDTESLGECLSRNLLYALNLILLAVLGFAGAYVAILRYDVR